MFLFVGLFVFPIVFVMGASRPDSLWSLVQVFWHLRNLLFQTETVNNKATFTKLTPHLIFDNGCSYANKNLSKDDREMWQLCFHREAALLPHAA